jgi:type IV pilus assembly protein PilA
MIRHLSDHGRIVIRRVSAERWIVITGVPDRRPVHVRRRPTAHGFALIDLIFVCGIIGVVCSIALPRLTLAKQAAGAASAIGSMRAINSAELTYALTCGSGFYAPNLSTLGTPPAGSNEPFIGVGLGRSDVVTKSGYIVRVAAIPYSGAPASCNGLAAGEGGEGFKASADPAEPGNARFFATNSTGVVFENTSSLATIMPEIGDPAAGHTLR